MSKIKDAMFDGYFGPEYENGYDGYFPQATPGGPQDGEDYWSSLFASAPPEPQPESVPDYLTEPVPEPVVEPEPTPAEEPAKVPDFLAPLAAYTQGDGPLARIARNILEGRETPAPVQRTEEEEAALYKTLGLVLASDVPYEEPKWLMEPYFQRGKGTLIQGEPDAGKTAFLCAIAAAVSTGKEVLGLPVQTPGKVLVLSGEDDPHIISGRIEADGGDIRRCVIRSSPTSIGIGSPEMEELIQAVRPKLLIIDPLQLYLGPKVDMHRANETRPALASLFDMCARYDCACAIVGHTAKSAAERSPIYKSLGSADIPAAMRSILHVMKHTEDPGECVAVHIKSSNSAKGPTLGYVIGDRWSVRFTRICELSAADLDGKPQGGFWSYEDVKTAGISLLGHAPFSTTKDLKSKVEGSLAKDLREKDGMVVTCGHRGPHGIRGLRVEVCAPPR